MKATSVILAKTVSDAIHLVGQLGERFLWVDKLCIVQDEVSSKKIQLDAIAAIYASSLLTIVSAQGDSDGEGLYGSLSARNIPKGNIESPEQVTRKSAWQLLGTVWYSRGWTFQENLFARRKLIFHHDTVHWECHCISWHEIQGAVHVFGQMSCEGVPPILTVGGSNTMLWPNMHRFARLVSMYNLRQLTFPEDALHAFASTLFGLSSVFKGGFLSGLPDITFDAVLIWQPYNPLTRRVPLTSSQSAVLPSWSWVGWSGDLHSESWRSAYDYMRKNPNECSHDGLRV